MGPSNSVSFPGNLTISGSIYGKEFSFLVDTGANVCAIRAALWAQIPELTKHPPLPLTKPWVKAVNVQLVYVLG